MLVNSKKSSWRSSRIFGWRTPTGCRETSSTYSTRGSSRHSSSTPLPTIPVAPKMTAFTWLRYSLRAGERREQSRFSLRLASGARMRRSKGGDRDLRLQLGPSACDASRVGNSALRLSNRAALDDVHQEEHEGDYQQDMERPAQRVARHETEHPQDNQQNDDEQHISFSAVDEPVRHRVTREAPRSLIAIATPAHR